MGNIQDILDTYKDERELGRTVGPLTREEAVTAPGTSDIVSHARLAMLRAPVARAPRKHNEAHGRVNWSESGVRKRTELCAGGCFRRKVQGARAPEGI